MLTLANDQLRLEILDPVADRAKLGPRFCWGGYLWQISDAKVGTLLTGPEWPKADPAPFNGQGLPESFRHSTRDGRRHTWNADGGVALGAGALNASGSDVTEPCTWQITPSSQEIVFTTEQNVAGFHYAITRTITLSQRNVRSISQLTNRAETPLMLEWFAHPFFALTDRLIEMEVPAGSQLVENPGFALAARTLTQKRRFEHEKDGHMDFLRLPAALPLRAKLSHPKLSHVIFETSFAPSECVIWGNSNTFSIEPYQTLVLMPGELRAWTLSYEFGAAR
ncbi:hypothetical protein [Oleiharenicola lentus]|uniref:hypothetical protein n=1 Tax=Oleiharenicola lentus TaxID=2508720 RepID=UPI003F67215C